MAGEAATVLTAGRHNSPLKYLAANQQEATTEVDKPYLNNHLRFKILFHTEPAGGLCTSA